MPLFDWYAQPKYKSIAETKGGRYGVSKYGGLSDSLTRYVLRKAGLDPERMSKSAVGWFDRVLSRHGAGQLDAAILSFPKLTWLQKRGSSS